METTKNKRNVLFAVVSAILMAGACLLFNQTLNVYYYTLLPFPVVTLSLLSVFLFVAGTTFMGRCSIKDRGRRYTNDMGGGIVFALLLVAAGVLLLGFNIGFLNPLWKSFFFSWQMLLVVLGVLCIFKFQFIWGIIFLAIGNFFLSSEISQIYPDTLAYERFFSTYWPAGIVLIGILILLSIITRPRGINRCSSSKEKWSDKHAVNENDNKDGEINYKIMFSASEQLIFDPIFKGGKIDVTFGGLELDLRRTSLMEGDTYLHVNTAFGGVEITVPDTWDVELRTNSFAGGVDDSRKKYKTEKDYTRKLIIVAKCSFGGIDIK